MNSCPPRKTRPRCESHADVRSKRTPQETLSAPINVVADNLRHREHATAQMVRALDGKIARLTQARADRIHALNKIRSALAQASLAGQVDCNRAASIL